MTSIHDLDTPALLVEIETLRRNIAAMADACRLARVSLRPHAKTHKCPQIARMQIDAGAHGLTCAKTTEADIFADAGFSDILVAYPLLGNKPARLRTIHDRTATRFTTLADSPEVIAALADAWRGSTLRVLIPIDTGYGRLGLWWEDADAIARIAARINEASLSFAGLLTHAGHAYDAPGPDGIARIAREEGQRIVHAARALEARGLPCPVVSVGSTPTARASIRIPGVTEARPGTYVFNDGTMIALGACTTSDCALTVLSTIVSIPGPGRAICDAGSKTLSSDRIANAVVLDQRLDAIPGVRLVRLSEEHGWLAGEGCERLRVGQLVRIIPGHVCPCVNLARTLHAVAADRVETSWPVAASGAVA